MPHLDFFSRDQLNGAYYHLVDPSVDPSLSFLLV